ncbi:MAG: hypothetical protein HFF03_00785 [Oscillospiraceae bacterium]|jgi:hypothetical protein|nr:hypothetical protein [Oscillospiraceae bacterium]
MAQNVVLYNLLISCPGDVQGEVKLIEDAVGEFNELYTKPLGITIQTRHWSKSSYAQSGGKPQALLNEQFVSECDAAVAIFWTRFGTPTDEYGSGTEEEIEIMLQSGKQVFMYFSDKSCPPSQVDDEGYKRVRAFREKYKDKGVYFTYSTDEEFRKLFLAHLSMYFLSDKRVKDIASERCSDLKLLGIDENGKLSEDVSIYQFRPNTNITMEEYMDSIRAIYQEIAGIKVGRRTSIPAGLFLYQPADINEEEKEFITSMAKILELELPEDFFDLGNLSKNPLSSDFLTGPRLEGSADEIRKYEKIQELQETISDALKWARVEEAFSDKRCIKLAIQNCGKAIDEDVEITVEIPQKSLLTLGEFPQFSNKTMGYLLNECAMDVLFGISSTAEYLEYSESQKNSSPYYRSSSHGLPGIIPDYSGDFKAELDDIFCYSIYPSGDNYILKLKVDYIKHNTSVAFPSVLFLTDEITGIPYKITSKSNPDIVEGTLKIQVDAI